MSERIDGGGPRDSALYMRQRQRPLPGDPLYLCLSDLRVSLEGVATRRPVRVLDFGADLSPYRDLFPESAYETADLAANEGVDLSVSQDGTLDVPAASFDLILSTQVLEHVDRPDSYLRECSRLLKPGGLMYVTTHGCFEDHLCPKDHFRWTADGLEMIVSAAGLQVVRSQKLTTGPRAVFLLAERCLGTTFLPRSSLGGFGLWALRRILGVLRSPLHSMMDRIFPGFRVVPSSEPGHLLYVGIAVVAMKPETAP